MKKGILILCVLSFVSAGILLAQSPPPQAPFVTGQIAVYAAPSDLPGLRVSKFLPSAGISVLSVEPGRELGQVLRLRQRGLRAGLNLIAEKSQQVNDPLYSPYQWHLTRIQSEEVWASGAIGTGVKVAVLDTGLATAPTNGDGINCVTAPRDIVNSDNSPIDGDGHGTHVSGTIAQNTNNGVGVAGLAYGSCIMPVKVLDDSGSGTFADIAEGIVYAVNNGAKVINMSLGVNARYAITSDPVMDPALNYAHENNVTVVCASGNDGSRKNVSYPASHPTTIAVGATDYADNVTRYSNKGAGLDLVAPGGDVTKDLNGDGYGDGVLQETFGSGGWSYYFYQGTSMASPHVAAAAALLYGAGIATTPDTVKAVLTSTTIDLGETGYDSTSGWGLIQANNALTGGPAPCTDADGDGFCEPEDCNDADSSIHPFAEEICGDGIDNNCNGQIDENCGTCDLGQLGDPCSSAADCCSGKCAGKPGAKVCK